VLQFRPSSPGREWNWGTCAGTGFCDASCVGDSVWQGLGESMQRRRPALETQLRRPQGLCWVPGRGLLICDAGLGVVYLAEGLDAWAWHRDVALPRALVLSGRAELSDQAEEVLKLLVELPDEEFRLVLSWWHEVDWALEEERRGLKEELEQRQQRIQEEKNGLGYDQERVDIILRSELDDEVLALNVGGEFFFAKRSTLCTYEGSYLANLFSGRWESSIERDSYGRFFLDFDPSCFRQLLNFLRSKRLESQRGGPARRPRGEGGPVLEPGGVLWPHRAVPRGGGGAVERAQGEREHRLPVQQQPAAVGAWGAAPGKSPELFFRAQRTGADYCVQWHGTTKLRGCHSTCKFIDTKSHSPQGGGERRAGEEAGMVKESGTPPGCG
ncbi:unnamed protein product, partial [Effrenium voratum]